jgi:hypothetical protein
MGWVQRLQLGNRSVVVIVVEAIVRIVEGSVELVVGMAGGPLCGQGSIASGHGNREGTRVGLLAVRHFRGAKYRGNLCSLARSFAPMWLSILRIDTVYKRDSHLGVRQALSLTSRRRRVTRTLPLDNS